MKLKKKDKWYNTLIKNIDTNIHHTFWLLIIIIIKKMAQMVLTK